MATHEFTPAAGCNGEPLVTDPFQFDGGGTGERLQTAANWTALAALTGVDWIANGPANTLAVQLLGPSGGTCTLVVAEFKAASVSVANFLSVREYSFLSAEQTFDLDESIYGLSSSDSPAKQPIYPRVTPWAYSMLFLSAKSGDSWYAWCQLLKELATG